MKLIFVKYSPSFNSKSFVITSSLSILAPWYLVSFIFPVNKFMYLTSKPKRDCISFLCGGEPNQIFIYFIVVVENKDSLYKSLLEIIFFCSVVYS